MQSYQYSMIGLSFDIVGAFLLSVEAIKLENLRAFRDRVLALEDYTRSPVIFPYFVGGKSDRESGRQETPKPVPASRYVGLFMGLHYVAGLALLLAINEVSGGWLFQLMIRMLVWTLDRPWYLVVLLFTLLIVFGIVVGLWMIGELVHVTISKAMAIVVKILDYIDSRTPDGTVGLIGFFALFVGIVFQMVGTYIARPHR